MSEALRVLVVGGLTRLDRHYREAPQGIEVDAIYTDSPALDARLEAADAIVLVLGNISHAAATKARSVSRRRAIPLTSVTAPSVSRVRGSIARAYLEAYLSRV